MSKIWLTFGAAKHKYYLQKRVMRVEEEKFRIPVDVRGSKTSVLKLPTVLLLMYFPANQYNSGSGKGLRANHLA